MTKDITTESGSQGDAGHDELETLDSILDTTLTEFESDESNSSATDENADTNLESAKADIPEELANEAEGNESTEQADILTPPEHWPTERKAVFESLSADAKKAWLEQAKDAERGLSQQGEKYAEQRKNWDAVDSQLKNFESLVHETGLSKPDFIGQLVQGYASLLSNPVEHIQFVMQQAGLKPEQLFGTKPQEQTNDEFVDPVVKKLQAELSEVKNFNKSIEAAIKQASHKGQIDKFQTYINNASTVKDDDGNAVYPYFDEELADTMSDIILDNPSIGQIGNPEQKFQMAYDLAVARNHKKYVELERQKERETIETKRGNDARTIKPQAGSHVPAIKADLSLDDIINEKLGEFGL